jgi:hypothetical protein
MRQFVFLHFGNPPDNCSPYPDQDESSKQDDRELGRAMAQELVMSPPQSRTRAGNLSASKIAAVMNLTGL